MNGGQSSIQVIRKSMSFPYAIRAFADSLACLLTCKDSKALNSCNLYRVPDNIVEMDIGVVVGPQVRGI